MTNAQKEQKFALTVKVWGLEQWGVSYLWRRLLFPKVFLFSSASSAAPRSFKAPWSPTHIYHLQEDNPPRGVLAICTDFTFVLLSFIIAFAAFV